MPTCLKNERTAKWDAWRIGRERALREANLPEPASAMPLLTAAETRPPFEQRIVPFKNTPVNIKKLHPLAIIPAYKTLEAGGADLVCVDTVTIPPWQQMLLPTGLAFECFDREVYFSIRSKSGMASKLGLHIGAGVIDTDYRGEVKILAMNWSSGSVRIEAGTSVAQVIVEQYKRASFQQVAEFLTSTARGEGGFGSTGVE